MAPDLDVLIRSEADPLLAIEHHRGFTHSLAFIPVGGLLTALPWLTRSWARARWGAVVATTTAGYATHGLLDACTTYGTRLLWPSARRVAWDLIAIIDPLFTLILLLGVLWGVWGRSRAPAVAALIVCALYLGLGALQHERAMAAQARIAAMRGHVPDRGAVFPAIGSNVVWRSLYRVGERLYADRIRVPWLGGVQWAEGSELQAVSERDLARIDDRMAADFSRFRWFADGWIARAPADPSWIADARYSLRMDSYAPVWGIRFHPGRPVPLDWVDRSRDRKLSFREMWAELAGTHSAYRPLPRGVPPP
jgi:inner membrane protein